MRKPLMAGNWKMNLNHLEAIAVTQKLAYSLEDRDYDAVEVVILPPFTDLRSVQTLVDGDRLRLIYGAQDISAAASGAYTGEISGSMLAKIGCTYVVIGHSERRANHNETDSVVNAKIKAALANEIKPILCVGEELAIREAGTHVEYVLEQLRNALKGFHKPDLKKIVIDVPKINSVKNLDDSFLLNIKYPLNSKVRYVVVYCAKNKAQIDVNDPSQIIDKIAFKEKSDAITITLPKYKLDTNTTCEITFIDFYGNESIGSIIDLQ